MCNDNEPSKPPMYYPGTPVLTPQGKGKVVYVTMKSPTYTEMHSVSVRLESRQDHPTYTGTKFLADDVHPAE